VNDLSQSFRVQEIARVTRKLDQAIAAHCQGGLLKSVGFRFCRPLQELEKADHVLRYFVDARSIGCKLGCQITGYRQLRCPYVGIVDAAMVGDSVVGPLRKGTHGAGDTSAIKHTRLLKYDILIAGKVVIRAVDRAGVGL
jgi:hypothetical protein